MSRSGPGREVRPGSPEKVICRRSERRSSALGDETGGVTVEAAIALGAVVAAVVLCIGAVLAAATQVRCVDAAREAARLAARGDQGSAVAAARRVAPPDAEISLRREGGRVVALVTADTPLLPGLELRAESVATLEPGETK